MTPAPGTLYVVPNTLDLGCAPVDVLDVLPLGTLRVAARLRHWAVEDAKGARAFLRRVDAAMPIGEALRSIEIVELPRPRKGAPHSGAPDLRPLLAPLLAGNDLGVLSEAGLPGVADPGAALVAAAHEDDLRVIALAGASALTLAVAAGGLRGQSFAFAGYLPTDAVRRAARLRALETLSRRTQQTQLMIETPYRNAALFDAMLSALAPSTRVAVSVGLTLAGGWSRTHTVARWKARRPALPSDVPAVFALQAD